MELNHQHGQRYTYTCTHTCTLTHPRRNTQTHECTRTHKDTHRGLVLHYLSASLQSLYQSVSTFPAHMVCPWCLESNIWSCNENIPMLKPTPSLGGHFWVPLGRHSKYFNLPLQGSATFVAWRGVVYNEQVINATSDNYYLYQALFTFHHWAIVICNQNRQMRERLFVFVLLMYSSSSSLTRSSTQ